MQKNVVEMNCLRMIVKMIMSIKGVWVDWAWRAREFLFHVTALLNQFLLLADFLTLSLLAWCYRCSFYDDTFSYPNASEFFFLDRTYISFYICTRLECIPLKSLFKYFKSILVSNTRDSFKIVYPPKIIPERTNRFNQTVEDLTLKL